MILLEKYVHNMTENEQAIESSEGIIYLGMKKDRAVFSTGSGQYRFKSVLVH